jgi:hypothetical protein
MDRERTEAHGAFGLNPALFVPVELQRATRWLCWLESLALGLSGATACTKTDDKRVSGERQQSVSQPSSGNTPDAFKEFAHQELIVTPPPRGATRPFMKELGILFESYEKLAKALAGTDLQQADRQANAMKRLANRVWAEGFQRESERAWATHAKVFASSLRDLVSADSLAGKRSHFAHTSEAMYCALKMFDGLDHSVKVLRCEAQGGAPVAYWLTADADGVHNPYGRAPSACKLVESVRGTSQAGDEHLSGATNPTPRP